MTNPLLELKALGQSVWLDDIDREQLLSGQFQRLIDEDALSGATGNPTIFEHSITHDITYDEQRIASRKSSFLLFKQTYSHDFALVFSPRPQLRSSAREQEKNMAYVREKEEDFS